MSTPFIDRLTLLIERAARPGLLGAAGKALERRARTDLRAYFENLGRKLVAARLEELATQTSEQALHAVDVRLHNILRISSASLLAVLSTNLYAAYQGGAKQDVVPVKEAAKVTTGYTSVDQIGETGQAAADWAAERAAKLVKDINSTTGQIIRDAIARAIEDQMGAAATGRLIRETVSDMTVARAKMIARTETADAMSQAAMDKMQRLGIGWKQTILSDDPCEICIDNADEDPLPIDEEYSSGDQRAPFHPNCRCATTGAQAPEDSE